MFLQLIQIRVLNIWGILLRRLTDSLIPDDAVFLFPLKAWSPRIASMLRVSSTQKKSKKISSGGMKLFGNRLKQLKTLLELFGVQRYYADDWAAD